MRTLEKMSILQSLSLCHLLSRKCNVQSSCKMHKLVQALKLSGKRMQPHSRFVKCRHGPSKSLVSQAAVHSTLRLHVHDPL